MMSPEEAVIGCLMLDPSVGESLYHKISSKMFEDERLGNIFRTCWALNKKGVPVDSVTVLAKLGDEYKEIIVRCAETAPSISRAEYYANAVLEAWRVREITAAALDITTCGGGSDELTARMREVLDYQTKIQSALDANGIKGFTEGAVEFLENLSKPDTSIKTGWEDFDRVVGGFSRKSVYVIAARPGKGKTDWALQLAMKAAMNAKVHYSTMEMPTEQLMTRIASRAGKIDSTRIRDKKLSQAEKDSMAYLLDVLAKSAKIRFDETPGATTDTIEEILYKYRPDVLFIDHLGLMNHGNHRNLWEGVAETTHRLKTLAMQHDCAIVELVQQNRRTDKGKATMGDLYGGSSVEQDADAVFSLDVPEMEHFLKDDESVPMTVSVIKNRNGGTGELKYLWQPQYHSYTPTEERYDDFGD